MYDELHDEFRPAYGYKRANSIDDQWVIEAKPTDGDIFLVIF